jgi:hypothetical protein
MTLWEIFLQKTLGELSLLRRYGEVYVKGFA